MFDVCLPMCGEYRSEEAMCLQEVNRGHGRGSTKDIASGRTFTINRPLPTLHALGSLGVVRGVHHFNSTYEFVHTKDIASVRTTPLYSGSGLELYWGSERQADAVTKDIASVRTTPLYTGSGLELYWGSERQADAVTKDIASRRTTAVLWPWFRALGRLGAASGRRVKPGKMFARPYNEYTCTVGTRDPHFSTKDIASRRSTSVLRPWLYQYSEWQADAVSSTEKLGTRDPHFSTKDIASRRTTAVPKRTHITTSLKNCLGSAVPQECSLCGVVLNSSLYHPLNCLNNTPETPKRNAKDCCCGGVFKVGHQSSELGGGLF
ncbi:hypothetical protein Bbelb_245570 [Branchiostoma belcheri]|nr:hypothetical protein Bbelb_245570 [Branchiostoma belcheri]